MSQEKKENETFFVSFYPGDPDNTGYAFRETLTVKANYPLHGRIFRMAGRKAKKMNAKSFAIFRCIRVVPVEYDDES